LYRRKCFLQTLKETCLFVCLLKMGAHAAIEGQPSSTRIRDYRIIMPTPGIHQHKFICSSHPVGWGPAPDLWSFPGGKKLDALMATLESPALRKSSLK